MKSSEAIGVEIWPMFGQHNKRGSSDDGYKLHLVLNDSYPQLATVGSNVIIPG